MESKSFLSEYKQSSSFLPLFALFNLFLISFCRWVSSTRIFLSRLFPLLQHHQRVFNKTNKKDQQESMIKHIEQEDDDDDDLCREDAEMVMRSLGLFSNDDELQERYSDKEVSSLFEEKEASLEEVKQAFDVFDENKDGFIDAAELQRVLTILGFKEGSYLENCLVMIRSLDENKDERIDFYEFVKFMERTSFY